MSAYTPLSFAPDSEAAQAEFTSNYDLDNPLQAISSYSRQLHAHTKNQLESSMRRATSSSSSSPTSSGRTSPSSKPKASSAPPNGGLNPRRTAASAAKPVSSMAQLENERSTQGSQGSL